MCVLKHGLQEALELTVPEYLSVLRLGPGSCAWPVLGSAVTGTHRSATACAASLECLAGVHLN